MLILTFFKLHLGLDYQIIVISSARIARVYCSMERYLLRMDKMERTNGAVSQTVVLGGDLEEFYN